MVGPTALPGSWWNTDHDQEYDHEDSHGARRAHHLGPGHATGRHGTRVGQPRGRRGPSPRWLRWPRGLDRQGQGGQRRDRVRGRGRQQPPRSGLELDDQAQRQHVREGCEHDARRQRVLHGAAPDGERVGDRPLRVPCRASRDGRRVPWDHLTLSIDTGPSRLRPGKEPGVRRVLRNPVVQFLVASLLLFGVIWWGTGRLSQTAARQEALADARVSTELLANSVAAPNIPKGMADGDPGAIDRFKRRVGDDLHPTAAPVKRIKIWSSDGTVLYSDQPNLILKNF